MAKKTVAKKAVKKAVGVKVKTKSKATASAKDIKNIHEMVDAVSAKDGSGVIIVLDTKNNRGTSSMKQVNSPEVAAYILGSIEGHADEVMPILIKMWMMNR